MAITSVLKYEGDNKTFIWKHPDHDFSMGSKLIVHESQEAVFMMDGEVLDTFGLGKHILETENLPVIKSVMGLSTGGRNAFYAELYFINLTEQMAIRWGTDSKISYLDPVYDFPIEIGACGEMSLSVANSTKLLIKLVGTEKVLSQEQLTKYFRSFLMTRAKSIIAGEISERKISIFEIDMHLGTLSDAVKDKLLDDFTDYGVNLNSFMITTVLKPDEDRNYQKFRDIYFRTKSDVMEAKLQQELTLIQQQKGFEVAKEVAQNEAAGDAVKSAVSPTPSMIQKRFCTKCGHELSQLAKFCEKCGAKAPSIDTGICRVCGFAFTNDAGFCPICGTKRGD